MMGYSAASAQKKKRNILHSENVSSSIRVSQPCHQVSFDSLQHLSMSHMQPAYCCMQQLQYSAMRKYYNIYLQCNPNNTISLHSVHTHENLIRIPNDVTRRRVENKTYFSLYYSTFQRAGSASCKADTNMFFIFSILNRCRVKFILVKSFPYSWCPSLCAGARKKIPPGVKTTEKLLVRAQKKSVLLCSAFNTAAGLCHQARTHLLAFIVRCRVIRDHVDVRRSLNIRVSKWKKLYDL
jgi:hypothetical protein